MMISNRTKRNLWLALSVMSACGVAGRAIGVADGSARWWDLACMIVVTAACVRFYLMYRRQVRRGNLFGHFDPLRRNQQTHG